MYKLQNFLGTASLNDEAVKFVNKGFIMLLGYAFLFNLTQTFFVLYALEHVSFTELGMLLGIQFTIQFLVDYPSGAIGDWIGQRWVLALSAVFYGIGFLVLGSATSFIPLALAFAFIALGRSQESGAFNAWFDNNYKLYAPEDNERKIYGGIFGKIQMLFQIELAVAFVGGGILVGLVGRSLIFSFQGLLLLGYVFIFLFFLKDHPDLKREEPKMKQYFHLLGEGVTTTFSHPTLRWVIVGVVISSAAISIWGNFILFPLYESYGKSDEVVGFIRAVIFLTAALLAGLAAILVSKMNQKQSFTALGIVNIFGMPIWLCIMAAFVTFFPAPEVFMLSSLLGLIVAFSLLNLLNGISNCLMPRFFLDIIPDKNRNSVFSLFPTLVVAFSIPANLIAGPLFEMFSLAQVILIIAFFSFIGGSIVGVTILRFNKDLDKAKSVLSDLPEIVEEQAPGSEVPAKS